jgi:hypothetical protein
MLTTNIKDIISIDMSMIQIDDYSSSFQSEVSVSTYNFNSTVVIDFKSLWFQNADWDKFGQKLSEDVMAIDAYLSDMSSEMQIHLKSIENKISLAFWSSRDFQNSSLLFQYKKDLDFDQFAILKNAFLGFEKWW